MVGHCSSGDVDVCCQLKTAACNVSYIMHNYDSHHEVVVTSVIVCLEISQRVNSPLIKPLAKSALVTNLSVQQHNACSRVASGVFKYSDRFIAKHYGENQEENIDLKKVMRF